jgi:SAM-dependent methyltransferase
MIDQHRPGSAADAAASMSQALQRRYYAETADQYEALHVRADDEHQFALAWLAGLVGHLGAASVLDVGTGTGRAIHYLSGARPEARLVGIEPVAALREQAYAKGLSRTQVVDGDVMALHFEDGAFDLVCAFGVLHHVPAPAQAISEMLRVARMGVFISDDNHFAAGGAVAVRLKRILRRLRLWRLAYKLKTRGRGYRITVGDGLAYPYSVFDDVPLLRQHCRQVHFLNTREGTSDLLASAGHVAVFARKA